MLKKLPAVEPPATIGIVASASPSFSPELIERGKSVLADQGFEVIEAPAVRHARGYLAGTAEERASDLMWAFSNPGIDAIIELRGGYGCGHVIPLLDFELIAEHRKPFVGMSDITLLHLAFQKLAGLATYWGPMVLQLASATEYSKQWLLDALADRPNLVVDSIPSHAPARTIVSGTAVGPLVGGTTTLVAASLGTQYEVETDGCLLLLEEVGAEPYEIDRSLTQLRHAGKLEHAAGFIVSEHSGMRSGQPFEGHSLTLEEVLEDILLPLNRPTVLGLPLGHGADHATVRLGAEAHLDADTGRVTVT